MAGKGHGFASYVAWGVESTYGTAVARTRFAELVSVEGGHQVSRTPIASFRSRTAQTHYNGPARSLKSFSVPFTYEGLEELLRAACWGYSFLTDTHTFTVEQNPTALPASLTLEFGDDRTDAYLYRGAYVKKIGLDFQVGQQVNIAVDVVALGEDEDTATTFGTTPDLESLAVHTDQIILDLEAGGDGSLEVDRLLVEIETGFNDGLDRFGSAATNVDIEQPSPDGPHVVTGTIERTKDDDTLYDLFLSGAKTSGGGVVATATKDASNVSTLTLSDLVVLGEPNNPTGPGTIMETISFQALYDATNTAFKLTQKNSRGTL